MLNTGSLDEHRVLTRLAASLETSLELALEYTVEWIQYQNPYIQGGQKLVSLATDDPNTSLSPEHSTKECLHQPKETLFVLRLLR